MPSRRACRKRPTAQSRFRVGQCLAGAESTAKFALALRLAGRRLRRAISTFSSRAAISPISAAPPGRRQGGMSSLPIDGLKDPAKLSGRPLTLTMVSGDIRLEQESWSTKPCSVPGYQERIGAIMIKVGDRLPEAEFITMTADGTQKFATGHRIRRPQGGALRGAGRLHADLQHEPSAGLCARMPTPSRPRASTPIACTAVNDVHVMNAWGRIGRRWQDPHARRRQWRLRQGRSASNST